MSIRRNVKDMSLFRATIPFFAQILVGTIASPLNTFISSGVNEYSMEAVGTAGSVMFLFGVLLTLLSGGSSVVIGHFIGNDSTDKEMKKAVDTAFWISLIQGIVLSAFMLIFGRYLLMAWGVKEGTEIFKIGEHYINTLAPIFIVSALVGYFIQSTAVFGHPKISMFVGITVTVFDAMLSSLFVFKLNMGVDAVIYGTVIARFIGFGIALVGYNLYVQRLWKIRSMSWFFAKKIMRISLPIAGEKINYNASRFVQGIIIGNIAFSLGLVIDGHNIMLQQRAIFTSIQSIVLIGGLSVAMALEPILARYFGEKNFKAANANVKKAMLFGLAVDIPIAIVICFISPYIVDLMVSKQTNHEIIKELKYGLKWAFVVLIFLEIGRVANIVYISSTRAAGDAKYSAYMSAILTWLSLLLSWVLARYAGLDYVGIVIGSAVDECSRGIMNHFRWKSGKWKKYIDRVNEREKPVIK